MCGVDPAANLQSAPFVGRAVKTDRADGASTYPSLCEHDHSTSALGRSE